LTVDDFLYDNKRFVQVDRFVTCLAKSAYRAKRSEIQVSRRILG